MKLELIKKMPRSKKKVPRVDFNRRKKGGEQRSKGVGFCWVNLVVNEYE